MSDFILSMFPTIPIIIVIILMLAKCDSIFSLRCAILSGAMVFFLLNGVSVQSIHCLYLETKKVLTGNCGILLSVWVLMILVSVINHSLAIESLTKITNRYINSPTKVIGALLVLGLIFSVDDYLSCLSLGAILTISAGRAGFSRPKTAYLVNMCSVFLPSISKYSSWYPVISGALISAGIDEDRFASITKFNLIAYLGILYCLYIGLVENGAFGAKPHQNEVTQIEERTGSISGGFKAIILSFSMLIAAMYSFTNKFPIQNPLLVSAILSATVLVAFLLKDSLITIPDVFDSMKEATKTTLNLSYLLLSVWLLVAITNNLLGLGELVRSLASRAHIDYGYFPAVVFIVSALFSFMTGSAFSGFGIFISLAAQLTSDTNIMLQDVTIAAAISGALMSFCSMCSDTLRLSAKSTGADIDLLQKVQLTYSVRLAGVTALAYLFLGFIITGNTNVLAKTIFGSALLYASDTIIFQAIQRYGYKYLIYIMSWTKRHLVEPDKHALLHKQYQINEMSLMIKLIQRVHYYNLLVAAYLNQITVHRKKVFG